MSKRYKIRRTVWLALGLISVPLALEAVPLCVRVYSQATHKVHHSKATVAKWKEWGKAHPHWHPRRKTDAETLAAVQWACGPMDFEQTSESDLLPSVDVPDLSEPGTEYFAGNGSSPITEVARVHYTPIFYPNIPVAPPVHIDAPTPEPSSLVLLGTGLVCAAAFTRKRF